MLRAGRRVVPVSRAALAVGGLVFAACLGAAVVLTALQERSYRASASLVVVPTAEVESVGDVLRALETLERRTVIATFARVPASPAVQQTAGRSVGLDSKLRGYRIDALVLPNTNILRIDVEGTDPRRTADVANALAAATREEVRSLYRVFTARPLAAAVPPARPFYPDPGRNTVVAALLGIFLGVLAALLVDQLGKAAPARRS